MSYKTSFSAARIRRSAWVGVSFVSLGLAGLSCGGASGDGPTGPSSGGATTIALSAGNTQTAIAGAATAIAPAVIVTNAAGAGVSGVSVTFTVATGGGSVTSGTQTTNASGIATVGSWILGTTAGANTMTVTSTGLTGSPVTFSATGVAGPAAAVVINTGNNQTAVAGVATPVAPSVKVTDANGNVVAGTNVTFAAASGGGSVTGATAASSATGISTVGSWTLGTTAGANTLTATVTGIAPATFTATGTAGAATQVAINAGNNQTGISGAATVVAPSVKVSDANGNGVVGVSVIFALASGGGSLTGGTQSTNSSGVATIGSWTLGTVVGTNTITATVTGVAPVTFTATGTVGAASQIALNAGNAQTAIAGSAVAVAPSVIVKDANGNVVSGVSVVFAVATGGGGVTGGTASTNAAGIATVGSWTLGATPGSNSMTATASGVTALTGSPVTFTATGTAGPAASLVFVSGPTTAAAGTISTPVIQVQARDAGNQLATSFTGNVTMTLSTNPGAATLGGTVTVAAVNGVATFSNLTVNKVGTGYVLSAASAGLTTATSPTFIITAAAPTTIAIVSGNAQAAAATTALPTPLTVKVTDSFGNAVSGITVNFAVTAGGGSVTPLAPVTDASGQAATTWTLGATIGGQTATASSTGLTGSPLQFTATGASSSLRTWTGATSTAWATASNWSPAGVPVATDSVVIPSVTNQPTLSAVSTIKALSVGTSAVLTLGCFNLNVNGSVEVIGAIAGCGPMVLTSSTAATLKGGIGAAVQVSGLYSLNGALTAGGLQVQGSGSLDINGQAVAVGATGLATAGSGTITMNQAASTIAVTGPASFAGGSEAGLLTNGTITANGDFTQSPSSTPSTFRASGAHQVILSGSGTQTVTFSGASSTYDASCAGSCFADLTISKPSGNVVFASRAKVLGSFTNFGSTAVTTPASNGSFIVIGAAFFGQNSSFHRVGVGSTYSKAGGTNVDSVTYFGAGQTYQPTSLNDSYSEITGTVGWSGAGTHTGNVLVSGNGQLSVSTSGAKVTGTFRTTGSGTLAMKTNATDTLVIGDTVTFVGGATTGLITTGTIVVRNSTFNVTGAAYNPSGTHTTVFNSTAFQTLGWSNPGANVGWNNVKFDSAGAKNFAGDQLLKGDILITANSGVVFGSYGIGWAGSTLTDQSGASPSKWQPGLWKIRGTPTSIPTTTFSINTIQLIGGANVVLTSNLTANYITVDSASTLNFNGHFVNCQSNYFTTQNGGTIQMTTVGDSLEANHVYMNGGGTLGLLTKGGIFVTGSVYGLFQQGYDAAHNAIANTSPVAFASSGTRVYFAPSFGTNVAFKDPGTGSGGSHFSLVQAKTTNAVNMLTDVFVDSLLVGNFNGATWTNDSTAQNIVRTITTKGVANSAGNILNMKGVKIVLNDGPVAGAFSAVVWSVFPTNYGGVLFKTTRSSFSNPTLDSHVYTGLTFAPGFGGFVFNAGTQNLLLGNPFAPSTCANSTVGPNTGCF